MNDNGAPLLADLSLFSYEAKRVFTTTSQRQSFLMSYKGILMMLCQLKIQILPDIISKFSKQDCKLATLLTLLK
jgi:hypothetical protein